MIQSGGRFETVTFARSMTEVDGDLVAARLSDVAHAGSFGQVLT
jgi:hypothetical protein